MLRYAARRLQRRWSVSTGVAVTVGLAMGAAIALFSLYDGLLFRPLPYPNSDRIVHLEMNLAAIPPNRSVPEALVETQRSLAATTSLEAITHVTLGNLFDEASDTVVSRGVRAAAVTPVLFDLLNVRPILGRPLSALDTNQRPRAVLLSYSLWRNQFGADPAITEQTLELPGSRRGERWRVIGVMPDGFDFPGGSNFWTWRAIRRSFDVPSYARLSAGSSIETLRAELPYLRVTSLRAHMRPTEAWAFGILLAATLLLMVVATVQVARFVYTDTANRADEAWIRQALGATAGRLVQERAAEAGILAAAVLLVGWSIAPALVSLVVWLLPPEMMAGQHVEPDFRAFGFGLALALSCATVWTLIPVLMWRWQWTVAPAAVDRFGTRVTPTRRLRDVLSLSHVALTTALVYVALLTLASFMSVRRVDLGFEPQGLLAIRLPYDDPLVGIAPDEEADARALRRQRVLESVRLLESLAGVAGVSGSNAVPVAPAYDGAPSDLIALADDGRRPIAARLIDRVRSDYFKVMGIPIVEGYQPTESIVTSRAGVDGIGLVMVNDRLGARLRRFGPVVGQVLQDSPTRQYRVVGIVQSVRTVPDEVPDAGYYVLASAESASYLTLVRVSDRVLAEHRIRTGLHDIWGAQATFHVIDVEDAARRARMPYRARSLVLGVIVILTLPIVALGIAGATNEDIRLRMSEIAVRAALGAGPSALTWWLLARVVALSAAAAVLGCFLGAAVGQRYSEHLFGVPALSGTAALLATSVVLVTGLLAAAGPARVVRRGDVLRWLRL